MLGHRFGIAFRRWRQVGGRLALSALVGSVLAVGGAPLVDSSPALAGTSVGSVTFSAAPTTPNPTTPTAASTWQVDFTTLTPGSTTVTINVPSGTILPSSASQYTINSNRNGGSWVAGPISAPSLIGNTEVTLTLPYPLAGLVPVGVTITGVINPPVGNYPASDFSVATLMDPSPANPSMGLGFLKTSPTSVNFTVNPTTPSKTATWTVDFATNRALNKDDIITITAPPSTTLPSSASSYVINSNRNGGGWVAGPATAPSVTGITGGNQVALTVPDPIGANTPVEVTISGVTNPLAGKEAAAAFAVFTTQDASPTNPPAGLDFENTAVTKVSFAPSTVAPAASSSWQVDFTTTTAGAKSITITGPAGTVFPAASGSYNVNSNLNGGSWESGPTAAPSITGGNVVAIDLPYGLAAGVPVGVTISGVTNPSGDKAASAFSVATSQDLKPASPSSGIDFSTTVSGVTVTPANPVAGATSGYTIGMTVAGALAGGTGTITLEAPAGTVLPGQASDYVITDSTTAGGSGTVTAAPTISSGGATAAITVPNDITGGDQLSVAIAGVTNPSAANAAYTFTVDTSADTAPVASASYGITLPPLTVDTASLPDATANTAYKATLTASHGTIPYKWSVNGSLPAGLKLDPASGTISGTPTTPGKATFTVEVQDSAAPSATATKSLNLTVLRELTNLGGALPNGTAGRPYSGQLVVSSFIAPLTWAISGGALPPGLNLDPSTGKITGTPGAPGTFHFTVHVHDGGTPAAVATYPESITIDVPPAPPSPPSPPPANTPSVRTNSFVKETVDTSKQSVTVSTSDDRVSLTFPQGSLNGPAQVSVSPAPTPPPAPPGVHILLAPWSFSTGGVSLNHPVTLTFSILSAPPGSGPFAVYTVVNGKWQFFTMPKPGPRPGTVTVTIPHFSVWTVMGIQKTFSDVPSSLWAYGAIEELVALGAVSGYPDGTFAPAGVVTRAEFVAMLSRALNLSAASSGGQPFPDIPASAWYAPYFNAMKTAGYLVGDQKGLAHPNDSITREAAAVILYRIMGSPKTTGGTTFTDQSSIAPWAQAAVEADVAAGIIQGNKDGSFNPLGNLLRDEAAAMITRLVHWKSTH